MFGLVKMIFVPYVINNKHSISMAMTPPTVNKAIINAKHSDLFLKMRIVNTR